MRWMVKLYDKSLQWSQHAHAPRYLAAVSFVEASVFPIPPYFMLAPMAIAQPSKAYRYALIATFASVFGGLLGYLLGYSVFKAIALPFIEMFGYTAAYERVLQLFQDRGFVAVLLAGFTPLPFKLVAIGAGFVEIPIASFFVASILGRGLKFFAVALVIKAGGIKMEQHIRLIIQKFGLVCLSLAALAVGCIVLSGCAEQRPVQVSSIKPTTYKVLPSKNGISHVSKKMHPIKNQPNWIWPAKGGVLSKFAPNNPKLKGIEIYAPEGTPVVAASDGEVVYSGNSLQGYGNLIIIKHQKNILTAYAHNRKNMVKEGDRVVVGQRIAEMGRTGTDKVKLHFEVRRDGKPIDPQGVLPIK
jgi:membrane protein YqaA with SNARE-associated domain